MTELENISRIPEISDRAGIGDGSVYHAVVALSGAFINAERELAALREQLADMQMQLDASCNAEELRQTHERLVAAEKDAARYRWLRRICPSKQAAKLFAEPSPNLIDAAIDAARREKP